MSSIRSGSPSIKKSGSVSSSTATESSSPVKSSTSKPAETEKAQPLPEEKKSQRKHEKQMSGVMKQAAFQKTLKDSQSTVASSQAPAAVAQPGTSGNPPKGLSNVQTEVIRQANLNAAFRKTENKDAALKNLGAAGVPQAEREQALVDVKKLILDSHPTVNFKADDPGRLERLSKRDGLEKMWDAPQGVFEKNLTDKRQNVEQRMHGYSDEPYKKGFEGSDRPTYMAVNMGNGAPGAAPYWGGSYFVAKKNVYEKSTLAGSDTFSDSFKTSGSRVGTSKNVDAVVAGMPEESLKAALSISKGGAGRPLPGNDYIEVQAHNLKWRDMEKLVLDRKEVPKGSDLEQKWEKFASDKKINVEYFDSRDWQKAAMAGVKAANENFGPKPK